MSEENHEQTPYKYNYYMNGMETIALESCNSPENLCISDGGNGTGNYTSSIPTTAASKTYVADVTPSPAEQHMYNALCLMNQGVEVPVSYSADSYSTALLTRYREEMTMTYNVNANQILNVDTV